MCRHAMNLKEGGHSKIEHSLPPDNIRMEGANYSVSKPRLHTLGAMGWPKRAWTVSATDMNHLLPLNRSAQPTHFKKHNT